MDAYGCVLGMLGGDNSDSRTKEHWKGTMMSLGAEDIRG